MQENRREKKNVIIMQTEEMEVERERQKRQNGGACGGRMNIDVLGIKRRVLV